MQDFPASALNVAKYFEEVYYRYVDSGYDIVNNLVNIYGKYLLLFTTKK